LRQCGEKTWSSPCRSSGNMRTAFERYLTAFDLGDCCCCAQQTNMHILVVEALLIATYSTWGRANTYAHRKTLSVENLSRANSWSLSSCTFPAGSCPAEAYECTSVRVYKRTSLRIATKTPPIRNNCIVPALLRSSLAIRCRRL
jgi:hypothetical protein